MICPNCAHMADNPPLIVTGGTLLLAHNAAACRDAAIQPHGCTCQHQRPSPPEPTTPEETR